MRALPARPVLANEMSVLIALREGADDEELLDARRHRAAKAFPDYEPLHVIALQHFTTAWGGSAQKMEAFRTALDGQYPEEKSGHALRTAVLVSHARIRPITSARRAPDWPLMRQGLDEIAQRYLTIDNLETITRYACWARDGDALDRWNRLYLSRSGFSEAVIATRASKAGPPAWRRMRWARGFLVEPIGAEPGRGGCAVQHAPHLAGCLARTHVSHGRVI
jgi:hypothetical protein